MQTPPKLGGRSSSGGSNGEPRVLPHRLKTVSNASSASSGSSNSNSSSSSVIDIKCPELLVRGDALQQKVSFEKLFKKGKRFESSWSAYFVAIYANTLFYYERLDELPRGVVPLAGSSVMAVDRIFKYSDSSDRDAEPVAEECGPCWKVTSSAGRVLLFRSASSDDRQVWIDRVNQANVEHPSHRRRSSSRRGSFEGVPSQGRRRRSSSAASSSSRHSFEELPLRYTAQQRHSDVASSASMSHDVSEMLRDAMQLVKQQKQEIIALKSKLRTLEAARDDATAAAAAVLAVEDAVALVLQDDSVVPVATASLDAGDAALLEQAEAIEAELEDHGSGTAKSNSDQAVEPTEAAAAAGSIDIADESTPMDASDGEDIAPVVVPPAPLSAPAQLEHVRPSDSSSSPLFHATLADAPTVFSASAGPTFGSASYSAPGNDYLQQQAMELAEIARSLQSSFRTDYTFSAAESAPSAASTYIESFSQRNSTSDMLSTDMFSFDDDHPFEEGDDYERLSEFDESDESFLEASGILDSIHQVMKDFIVTSTPEKQPDQIIISDDVIAEIRQGIERKDAEEARRLRQLRSLSDFNDSSTAIETPDPSSLQRAKSARDFVVDFGVGGIAKMSRPRRDLGTLVVEDSMTVVSCVLQTVGREEKMVLLYPLLRLFGSHNRLSRLIRWAIEIEVASVINVATLFRSDDYASRLVSSYSKCVGLDFIRVVLAEPIREILTLKIADLELNPDKHASLRDESTVTTNAENLMRACQNILDAILQNARQIPSSYFHICSHLNAKVIRRFDGSCEGVSVEDPASLTRSVIGGFLFLRFVCPAITTPHLYNLTEKEPPPESRRVLVLLTKLLFKTATCVMFGDREPQFKILNPFIERNSPAIQQLFVDLSTPPERDIDECFAADSRNIFSDVDPTQLESDATVIRSITEKHLDEIGKKLAACGFPPQTTSEFKVAVLAPSVGPRETPHHAFLDAQKLPKASKKLSVNKFLSFGKKSRKPHTDV